MSGLNTDAMIERWRREVVRRLTTTAAHVTNELKKTVSVPAPRKRIVSFDGWGEAYYRATTRATTGAPPRKLSGHGRRGIAYVVDKTRLQATVGVSVWYMAYWEDHGHAWVQPTLDRERATINAMLAGKV